MRRTTSSVAVAITSLCACLVVGSSTDATAAHTVKTKNKPKQGCSVDAGGSLSGKRSFELEAELERGKLEGELEFSDKTAKLEFESTSITNLVVAGKLASVQGRGKTKTKGSATLRFSATLDATARTFALNLSSGYSTSGALAAKSKGKGADGDDDHELELDGSCPFDGVSTPVLDPPRRVSATIGRAGGTLGSGGLTLTIPTGALSENTTIALTPLLDLADSPLAGTIIRGAKLEPEGLRFLRPAVLTFALPAGTPAGDVIGFGSAGDGSDLYLQPHTLAGGTISLRLWHFSTAGGSSGGSSAATAVQRPISNAQRQAMQRIAAAWRPCTAEQAQGIFNGPACANVTPESVRALFDWYTSAVRPGLQGAPNAPSFDAEAALAEWLAWEAEVYLVFKNDPPPICGNLQSECDAARALATTAVRAHVQRRLNNCTGTSLAGQIRDVARMADFAGAGALDITGPPLNLPSALNGDLVRACAHLEVTITDFPAIAALNVSNTLRGRVVVDVHSGPDRTDVPFALTVDGGLVGTAADGSFQTTLTPTSAGQPLNVDLEAQATNPLLQNTEFTDLEKLVRATRERLQFVALSPTTVPAGGAINVLVRVAGDGMAGMQVFVGGPGSAAPSPIVTNSQGVGTAVFTVLSNATQTSDALAAELPDGTTAVVPITVVLTVTVTISPATTTLGAGGTQNFTATVTGSLLGVTWSATGGVIVDTGTSTAHTARFDAGSTPGTFSVTATSIDDPTASGSATVTITPSSSAAVQVIARASSLSAVTSVTPGNVGTSDEASTTLLGPWSDSVAATHEGVNAEAIGFRRASSDATQSSTVAAPSSGPALLSVDFDGVVNASAAAERSGQRATATANARTTVTFDVTTGSPGFAATVSGGGPGPGAFSVRLRRLNTNGTTTTVFDSAAGPVPANGTLGPGRYELHAEVSIGIQTPFSGGSASGGRAGFVTFGVLR